MKKTREKFLAVLLTFAMLFGSSLTVIAEEIECKDLNVNDVLTEGEIMIGMLVLIVLLTTLK